MSIIILFLKMLSLLFLLRFLLPLAKVDYFNPVSQITVRYTDFILKPIRPLFSTVNGFDTGAIFIAFILYVLLIYLKLNYISWPIDNNILFIFQKALFGILLMIVDLYFYALILSVILSWLAPDPNNPIAIAVNQFINPLLSPIQKVIPPFGMLDFSPIVLFILINIAQNYLGYYASLSPLLGIK